MHSRHSRSLLSEKSYHFDKPRFGEMLQVKSSRFQDITGTDCGMQQAGIGKVKTDLKPPGFRSKRHFGSLRQIVDVPRQLRRGRAAANESHFRVFQNHAASAGLYRIH